MVASMTMKDLPTGRLSFSQVDTYLTCAKKYEWKYIIKPEAQIGNISLSLGKRIHEVISEILTARMENNKINIEKLITNSSKQMQQEVRVLSKLLEVPLSSAEICRQHNGLLNEWVKDVYPEFNPTAVEKEINTVIGGYPFLMYVDVINDGKEVIDWKVTASPKNVYTVANSLQLSCYSIGTELSRVGFGSLVRPKEGHEAKWQPKIQIVRGIRTKSDLNWATYVIKKAAEGILKNIFPICSPETYLCSLKYCDYWMLCRGKTDYVAPTWLGAIV